MPKSSQRDGRSHQGKTTTDHKKIRQWVESRGGHPATVKSTTRDTAGVLRIDFPGYRGKESLKEISWDDFFDKFDREGLAFLYQDKTAGGKTSRFSKFVQQDGASGNAAGQRRGSSKANGRSTARSGAKGGAKGNRTSGSKMASAKSRGGSSKARSKSPRKGRATSKTR